MSFNKAIIMGNLGQDPELKYTPGGTAVCNMSIATTEKWSDKATGTKQEKTEWHRIVVWGKLAEICNQYLSKGKGAMVEGRIETRSWDDKDGKKRYTTEIIASNVQFLNSNADKNTALQDADKKQGGYDIKTDASFAADDIPF